MPGGKAPAPKPKGAGNPVESNNVQTAGEAEALTRSASRVERVSRALSDARSAERKARGRPRFWDTGSVQMQESPCGRSDRGKATLSPAAERLFASPVHAPATRAANRLAVAIQGMTNKKGVPHE